MKSVYCRLPCMLAARPEHDRPNSRFADYPKIKRGVQVVVIWANFPVA